MKNCRSSSIQKYINKVLLKNNNFVASVFKKITELYQL